MTTGEYDDSPPGPQDAALSTPASATEAAEAASQELTEPGYDAPPLQAALEAVLLVTDEPVPAVTLAQVVERPTDEVEAVLRALAEDYAAAGRGFELRQIAGGWRLYTRADCA